MDKTQLSQEEIDTLLAASAGSDEPSSMGTAEAMPMVEDNARATQNVTARPVEFEQMVTRGQLTSEGPENVSLILDIPMEVTVELGRARKFVREVLAMNTGSVVELDKQAGEPVDVLVNGKLLARGEVVVIDENFGVRISEVVSKNERLIGLK